MIDRFSLDCPKHPNFIGSWMLQDTVICDNLIEFFENNKKKHSTGTSGNGIVAVTQKNSTDLSIHPSDLKEETFKDAAIYMEYLKACYLDYLDQWSFLKSLKLNMHIGPFNIQKYEKGGHFGTLHSERTSLKTLYRTLVWMTYLNDVKKGGETEFSMFGLKIRPEKGKTLIWPAEWTHAHLGAVVPQGRKYIITGWMHFPIS
jgi:hypothetical protein